MSRARAPYGERSRQAWADGLTICAMCGAPAPSCRPDAEGLVLHVTCAVTWKGVRRAFDAWSDVWSDALRPPG